MGQLNVNGISTESLRVFFFFLGFVIFTLMGILFAFRKTYENGVFRLTNNVLLIVLNSLVLRTLAPVSLVVLAAKLQEESFGFLNTTQTLPFIEVLFAVVFLDLVVYFQHILTHKIPVLWRLHRVHHTDIGFDTSTALRFHPLEILFSLGFKSFFVILLGPAPLAVVLFEALVNFSAMFNHGNFSLSQKIEKYIRAFIVTPDMHRIHHSVMQKETDSNYGFFLSVWDRVFQTYRAKPEGDPLNMEIGIEEFREMKDQRVDRLLIQPFLIKRKTK